MNRKYKKNLKMNESAHTQKKKKRRRRRRKKVKDN